MTCPEIEQWEAAHDLAKFIRRVPDRNWFVLVHRFGLRGCKPRTLDQVASMLGISRERTRQLQAKGIAQIRRAIRVEQDN